MEVRMFPRALSIVAMAVLLAGLPAQMFQKVYIRDTGGGLIARTSDGGVVIGGYTWTLGRDYGALLARIDGEGTLRWAMAYGLKGEVTSVQQTHWGTGARA
jgi:hypothetical protein